jgi:hypothetical protein
MSNITLPESCLPILARFNEAEKAKLKLAAEIRINGEKSKEAELALAEAQHGDPSDPASAQRLTDCMMRRQLYVNHAATLEKRLDEAVAAATQAVRDLAVALNTIGIEEGHRARLELRDLILARCDAYPSDVERGIFAGNIRSREETAAAVLEGDTRHYRDEDARAPWDPFSVWPKLVATWERFANRKRS